MMQTYKCQKATLFVLNERIHQEFFSDSELKGQDKYHSYIHGVMYDDEQEPEDRKLLAISRGPSELCQTCIVPSLILIEKEVVRTS